MLSVFRVRNYIKKRPRPKYTVENVRNVPSTTSQDSSLCRSNFEENIASNSEHNVEPSSVVNLNTEIPINYIPSTTSQGSSLCQESSFSNKPVMFSSNTYSPRDIVGIFSNQLLQYKQSCSTTEVAKKAPIP